MNDHSAPRVPASGHVGRRTFLAATGAAAAWAVTAGGRAHAAPAPAAAGFAVPVDTTPHTRTWMAWPDSSAIWGRQLAGVQADIALIAKTVARYEPVTLCANPASVAKARSACGPAVTVIGSIPVDDCWMRDTGPVFRTDGAGGLDAVGLNFNGWGNKQTHAKDALVAQRIAASLGVPFTAADLVGEGGAVETDGNGTLMATRSSLINANRNPGLKQAQIEAALCDAFGADQVIWFNGVTGRDITDDHVDATSRFLAAGSGLVQMPLATDTDAWSKDARQQYQILSKAKDADGDPIRVAQIQGPDYGRIRSSDPDFVAAYANYYVCNGAVISAQFGDARADAAARSSLQRLFPGRVVEQLDIDSLGAGGGGIHCVTQQQPRP
ncbi:MULTISPECIES: agmatine deiminase family protein [Streptomyces]|uniref:Porphyromonas-type peptidyl-arginine deiminase n=1 Tax=Streptomyces xanthochromogenes TaxID=67384 RepID=A0ABQ3AZR3_9ACTN|nr:MULTISPECIES: agmatine deiminase family protein [Streptomyces]MYV89125.1 agmatine deiminase family protein [Streptomyces sp. SID1034]GGY72975.1 porphyromonas-type peptidyl-arginine deiminase [Streptomyces xanthochromogenes]